MSAVSVTGALMQHAPADVQGILNRRAVALRLGDPPRQTRAPAVRDSTDQRVSA